MARKSRKNITSTVEIHKEDSSYYMTAIYARLSVENSGKDDKGDSIANQIMFCKHYLQQHPDLKLYGVYRDNGETGTNFHRPEFQRLMNDVKARNVRCIVVKDLSRFGRNYIETGEYLEKIFPFLGVRFIAVTDGYDSLTSTDSEVAFMMPLKNMINDVYAKDISRKIITSFRARQEKGEVLPAFAPYGYVKSKTDRYRYEVDNETAPYVRMMFEWKADGVSHAEICRRLNEMGAITPARRKVELGSWNVEKYKDNIWYEKSRSLVDILKNPTYTGCIVYGRKPQSLYQGIKKHRADKEEWRILPNMHEAIVSQQLFDKVQEMFSKKRTEVAAHMEQSHEARGQIVNLFKNKIYCGDCNKRMRFLRKRNSKNPKEYTYERAYFECGGYIDTGYGKCTSHRIGYLMVYDTLLAGIHSQLEIALKQEELLKQLKGTVGEGSLLDCYVQNMNSILWELQKVNRKREQLFEDFVEAMLDETEYKLAKQKYDEKARELQKQLRDIEQKKERVEHELSENNQWLRILHEMEDITELNQEIVDRMIKRIRVYEGKRIEMELNHRNEKCSFEGILEERMAENRSLYNIYKRSESG